MLFFFFFQAEDGIRYLIVTGVQTCALPISLESAGRGGQALGERAGLYMAVGSIPFEREHTDLLLRRSIDPDGRVSMARFSTDAFGALNPLLTFRCLSNMPAFHVSVNF